MKVTFKELVLHNFGSYVDASITLQNKGFCLVSGTNNCKQDNAKSNGAGKSFLWSGICYALTGETIQGLKTNLKNINVAEKDMSVKLTVFIDDDEYIIERGQSGSKFLYITKNGIDISGKTFTESTDKLAAVLPDLSRNLISSIIILGQGMPNKFSSYSPAGRKELLEQLTKSDFMIEDIKERVETRQTSLQKQLREYQDSLLVHNTNLNTYNNTLATLQLELKNKIKPDFDKEIAVVDLEIIKYTDDNNVITQSILTNETALETKNTELLNLTAEKGQQISLLEKNFNDSVSSLVVEKANLSAIINSLTREIKQLESITDVCPTCGQKLANIQKPDTTAKHTELNNKQAELGAITAKLAECDAKRITYLTEINEAFDKSINTLKTEVVNYKKTISELKQVQVKNAEQLSILASSKNKLLLDKDSWDKSITAITVNIENIEKNIVQTTNNIVLMQTAVTDVNEHMAVINKINTLIKRDFRGFLLTNIITYLDAKAKDYCEIVFGTRELSITIDGNALNITYCNKLLDNLSGGEKQRVDLILQFAIRNLLEAYLGVTSNIIVLDEITDFLDKISCDAVMSLIERELKATESVFIVSHHVDELELPVDSEICIEKGLDGNSRIV